MEEKFEEGTRAQKILSLLFFATFLILVLSFLFLFISQKSLEKKKEEYQERIKETKTKEVRELERKIGLIQVQLRDAEKIGKEKYFTQKFFDFLEKNKMVGIKISSAEFDFEQKKARISAEGPDFLSVTKQLKVFESLPEIENFSVSEVSLEKEGKVKFNFSFSFKEDLIK
jgi:predicted DNA binding CopG/RHH family protein